MCELYAQGVSSFAKCGNWVSSVCPVCVKILSNVPSVCQVFVKWVSKTQVCVKVVKCGSKCVSRVHQDGLVCFKCVKCVTRM